MLLLRKLMYIGNKYSLVSQHITDIDKWSSISHRVVLLFACYLQLILLGSLLIRHNLRKQNQWILSIYEDIGLRGLVCTSLLFNYFYFPTWSLRNNDQGVVWVSKNNVYFCLNLQFQFFEYRICNSIITYRQETKLVLHQMRKLY